MRLVPAEDALGGRRGSGLGGVERGHVGAQVGEAEAVEGGVGHDRLRGEAFGRWRAGVEVRHLAGVEGRAVGDAEEDRGAGGVAEQRVLDRAPRQADRGGVDERAAAPEREPERARVGDERGLRGVGAQVRGAVEPASGERDGLGVPHGACLPESGARCNRVPRAAGRGSARRAPLTHPRAGRCPFRCTARATGRWTRKSRSGINIYGRRDLRPRHPVRSQRAARPGARRALPDLCALDHHAPGAAGRARRAEAGASAHPLRDAGLAARPERRVPEVREDRRRGDGQLPSARRPGDLRRLGAAGAGLRGALPAGRRAGQLRQHRRRQPGGAALHRGAADRRRGGADGGAGRGRGRLPRQLRRLGAGAGGAAGGVPEPARQRLVGDRGRDGDQHPAAQYRRARQRLPASGQASGGERREAARLRAGAGLPDRRGLRRDAGRDQGGLPDRARLVPGAGALGGRGPRTRHLAGRRHRDSVSGAEGQADRAAGRARQREEGAAARRRARRERRGRADRAGAAGAHRRSERADGDAVPGERPRDPLRDEHERADRRAHAAGLDAEAGAARLPRPPARGAAAAVALPARQDRRPARGAGGAARRLPEPRPGDRDHQA